MSRSDLHSLMDACRPGSDDHLQPEMAELARALEQDPEVRDEFERRQQADTALAAAITDAGDPPEGLAARLLAAVDDAAQPQVTHWTRRRWVQASVLAAAAAVAGVAVWWNWPEEPTVDGRALALQADAWQLDWDSDAWSAGPAPADYPLDINLRLPSEPRWRRATTLDDDSAVVYLSGHAAKPIALYVVRTNQVRNVGSTPPFEPQFNTGQRRIGVWQDGPLVYVLVVHGNLDRYHSLLDEPLSA